MYRRGGISFGVSILSTALLTALVACGGGGDEDADAGSAPAGSSGAGGGSAGTAAGKGGSGGNAGGASGASGAGGASGTGGAGGAGKGGTAGAAGTAGTAGTAGKGGAGSAGSAGSAGGSSTCAADTDCKASVPTTTPAGCAAGKCDPGSKKCVYVAVDADGDGFATSKCKANDGTPIQVGTDCDDTSSAVNPDAWDGPKGDGKPDRCDGVDQNCSGTPDDVKLASGASCTCSPGDVQPCSTDASGAPVDFPKLDGAGKPFGACKLGSKQCQPNGSWAACVGTVGPKNETCNKLDDDCNGTVDDDANDRIPFVYDGDNDLRAGKSTNGYAPVLACPDAAPVDPPLACTKLDLPCSLGATLEECCPKNAWKPASSIPQDDCDDRDAAANPLAAEVCADGKDNNCNGKIDNQDGCVCTPGASEPCSEKPSGAPITWPLGVPAGTCAYGAKKCADDGKSWGSCIGAIAPSPSDTCFAGNDDSCNNVANEGCSCSPNATQPCGVTDTGPCQLGVQTCGSDGQWGVCVNAINPKPADTCESGNDDNCNGTPNDGCGCVVGTTTGCGSAATCNYGATMQCLNGASYDPSTCSVKPVADIGTPCPTQAQGGVGACVNAGTKQCASVNESTGATTCVMPSGVGAGAPFTDHKTPWIAQDGAQSWDWNCNGTLEHYYSSAGSTPNCIMGDPATYDYSTLCKGTSLGACVLGTGQVRAVFKKLMSFTEPACGAVGQQAQCDWGINGPCTFVGTAPVTQTCK